MPWSVCGLVFYYYVTNYNKFSGLKQYLCVSSQFMYVRSLSELNWVLCVWSHKTEIKVSETLGFYLAVKGRNSFPISFRLLVDFLSFLQLQDWRSVFSCWLSAGVCSLLLATIPVVPTLQSSNDVLRLLSLWLPLLPPAREAFHF